MVRGKGFLGLGVWEDVCLGTGGFELGSGLDLHGIRIGLHTTRYPDGDPRLGNGQKENILWAILSDLYNPCNCTSGHLVRLQCVPKCHSNILRQSLNISARTRLLADSFNNESRYECIQESPKALDQISSTPSSRDCRHNAGCAI